MASINPPVCDFGWQAPHFSLPNFNDHMVALHAAKGKNGLLVMFICNHCPYVKAILHRLINDVHELQVARGQCAQGHRERREALARPHEREPTEES